MPLIPTPHQPLAFGKLTPVDNCDCDSTVPYLLNEDDTMYAQFIQTPCGDNLVCDGNFTGVTGQTEQIGDTDFTQLSNEQLVNSEFTGNANNWVTNQFTYSTNAVEKTNNASTGALAQGFAGLLVDNAMYRVRVVITADGGNGSMFVRMTSTAPSGNIDSASFSGVGTHDIYFKAVNGVNGVGVITTTDWTGEITTFSVRRVASLWDFSTHMTMNQSTGIVETIGNVTLPFNYNGSLQPNTSYQVEIEFDGNGDVAIEAGGTLSAVQTVSGNQTKTWSITTGSGNNFSIRFDAGYEGSVISVSVLNLNYSCWDIDEGEWIVNTNSLCKIQGNASIITNQENIPSGLYQCFVTISGRTQGSVTVILDTESRNISSNGRHEFYFTPSNTSQLTVHADASFNGCITQVELYVLKTDYVFKLVRENGVEVADLSDYVSYFEKYVTFKFKLSDIQSGDLLNDESITYGCYRIKAYDTCEIQYAQIWNDTFFDNPKGVWWDLVSNNPNITMNIAGGELIVQATSPANGVFYFIKNFIIPFGVSQDFIDQIPAGAHNYRARFDIVSNTDPANITVGAFGAGTIGGYGGSAPGSYSVDILNFDPEIFDPPRHFIWLVVRFLNNTTGTVIIDNARLNRIEPFTESFTSRLISYNENHPCTELVRAWAEKPSYGFEFVNTGFYLQQRVPVKALAPEYPQVSSQYLHSSGVRTTLAGQNEKQWLFIIDYSPEEVHDTMAIQKVLQNFEINHSDGFIAYTPEAGDYTPEWNVKVTTVIAPARFKITKKDGTKFMKI